MPKHVADIEDDDAALLAVCGGESMVDKVKATWEDILENKRMDVSGQGLDDDGVARLLKGLHMCAGCALGPVVPLATSNSSDS
jgi:hypothetical protein